MSKNQQANLTLLPRVNMIEIATIIAIANGHPDPNGYAAHCGEIYDTRRQLDLAIGEDHPETDPVPADATPEPGTPPEAPASE